MHLTRHFFLLGHPLFEVTTHMPHASLWKRACARMSPEGLLRDRAEWSLGHRPGMVQS